MFKERLALLMNKRSVSQQNLASVLGIARQSISQYLEGNTLPNAEKICAMADYFGVSTDYLLGRTDCQSPEIDVQEICKKTGLSNDAVLSLIDIYHSDKVIFEPKEGEDFPPEVVSEWSKKKNEIFAMINSMLSRPMLDNLLMLCEAIDNEMSLEYDTDQLGEIEKANLPDYLQKYCVDRKTLIDVYRYQQENYSDIILKLLRGSSRIRRVSERRNSNGET